MLRFGCHFGAGPQMKQWAGDRNQSAEHTRGEHVQDPGRPKEQIGLAIIRLLLLRTKEWEQDFADFQNTDIRRLFQTLRDRIKPDELRLQQRPEQVSVGLPGDERATLRGQLPAPQPEQLTKNIAMNRGARQPFPDNPAG